jgi:hypothetical protein
MVAVASRIPSGGNRGNPFVATFFTAEEINPSAQYRTSKRWSTGNDFLHCIHGSPIVEKPLVPEESKVTE